MSVFQWSEKSEKAAIALANGETQEVAADIAGVSDRTIRRWLDETEFSEEVDRLTFLTGVAQKAERLRLAKRVIKQLGIKTEKDLLDWLKYMQSETDGTKLDFTELLTAFTENGETLAAGRSTGVRSQTQSNRGDDTSSQVAADRTGEV